MKSAKNTFFTLAFSAVSLIAVLSSCQKDKLNPVPETTLPSDQAFSSAARIQQDFLPKSLPQVGPVHFHSLFRPAGYVSGDLYDVMRLDEFHRVGHFARDSAGGPREHPQLRESRPTHTARKQPRPPPPAREECRSASNFPP